MSLLTRICSWRAVQRVALWRHDLRFYWYTWEKGNNLVFFTLLGGALAVFGSFGWFAYADHARIVSERQRQADVTCLARNIYFEARGEPIVGQYAVAEVTMNRVSSPYHPNTVCEVVHEKHWIPSRKRYIGAFSWTELESLPRPRGIAWQRAREAAETVYDARHTPAVHGALFYHANHVQPAWAKGKKQVAEIGRHIFYE
jgi:spore germination cell wall hydrolase CwlJ-like protein